MHEINCFCFRATILQHESSQLGKVNTESVAKPALMRAGSEGELIFIQMYYLYNNIYTIILKITVLMTIILTDLF